MEARMRLFGHPIHQTIIVLPLGLLTAAWLFDIGYWITRSETLGKVAYWNMGLGILTGLIAAVFGFLDWRGIPGGTRAKRVGIWHATTNIAVILLFAISWTFRWLVENNLPSVLATCFATVALALAVLSGWLGGELVNRYTIGIKDNAGLNAAGPFVGSEREPMPGEQEPHHRTSGVIGR